jgi:hypothetical protein
VREGEIANIECNSRPLVKKRKKRKDIFFVCWVIFIGSASQRRLVQRQRFRHWLYKSYDAVFLLKKEKEKES